MTSPLTGLAVVVAALASANATGAEPPTLEFAGQTWQVKQSDQRVGPGPNVFSADPRDVWVDDAGHLHLTISHRDGTWRSTELWTARTVGYGTYEFRVAGGVDQLDPNVVLGLFTWDNDTWQSDANSEIDVEFSRWTEATAPNLYYSVHPTRDWGKNIIYPERFLAQTVDLQGQPSTHVITWTPDQVTCASYLGDAGPDPQRLIRKWRFAGDGEPRITTEGDRTTDPILIPRPGPATRAHLNLWLTDAHGSGAGTPPTDGRPVEVVITGFSYTPYAGEAADGR